MPESRRRSNPVMAASVLIFLFLAAAQPLILSRYSAGRAAEDQNKWHLPVIRQFAREWPYPNLRDYGSATTPGYHLLLAVASRLIGSSEEGLLRALNTMFTIALLATLAVVAARRGTAAGVVLCLPALTSLYIFSSGVWLLPDNAGWLGVLLAMMLALRRWVDLQMYVGSAILIFLLVLVRQIDLWVAAPICVAAWMDSELSMMRSLDVAKLAWRNSGSMSMSMRLRLLVATGGPTRVAIALWATVPAIIILCIFFHLWHGLVPPAFNSNRAHDIPGAGEHTGGNLAATALLLSTFTIFAPFYLAWISRPKSELTRTAILIGSIAGFLAGVLPRTSYDMEAGRWSGLWNLARHAPTIANRSTAIAPLSTIGGGLLGYIFSTLSSRDRWIFLASWIAFAAAQSVNRQAWQRYVDPFVLIMLILIASRAEVQRGSGKSGMVFKVMRGLPVVLAVLLAAITVASLR